MAQVLRVGRGRADDLHQCRQRHARRSPRLAALLQRARRHAHVEITNLIIPGHNDSSDDLADLADWIAGDLGAGTPVHLSAYFPRYELQATPTSPEMLNMAYDIFAERLHYVYLGNVRSSRGNDTICRHCGCVLIRRDGYSTSIIGLDGSRCAKCCGDNNIIV